MTLRVSQDDLVLERSDGKLLLRLSNEIGNRGRGPLEIYPSPSSNDCDGDGNPANDRDAYQRIFQDSNADDVFDRAQDTESDTSCSAASGTTRAHHHWHVLDFARYKLVREQSGRTVARSTKIGFCIIDTDHRFASLPGSPPEATTRRAARTATGTRSTASPSAGPTPTATACPGSSSNVTGLRRGRYCLVSTADPHNLLRESDNSNNARRTRIALRPAKRTVEAAARPLPDCSRAELAAGSRLGLAGSPSWASPALPAQCASGEGGVSRRYHSASSAPMQPVPAAVTAWR